MNSGRPSQIASLEAVFRRHVNEGSDHWASQIVRPLLEEAAYAAGENRSVTGALFDRAFKAIELLNSLPPYTHANLLKVGFPETRYLLWKAILLEMKRGSAHTPVFAKAILKKVPLSEDEAKRLRDVLKDFFEQLAAIEVRQSLFTALKQTRKNSEPVVVRAILRTILQKADDDKLMSLVLAIQWR